MQNILESNRLILMEAAVIERLRRLQGIHLHPGIINAPLIYDELGSKALADIYKEYIDIAFDSHLPFLMCTPTWRTNKERVRESNVNQAVNADCVKFLRNLANTYRCNEGIIKIGGMTGCKNDCYKPDEALSEEEAKKFHSWQIDRLAQSNVDYLLAATLPEINEAKGIAEAMGETGIPYIISFVISRKGTLLDGTRLDVATDTIDSLCPRPPMGYSVNCAYPTFLCADKQNPSMFNRLIGFQANSSSLDHEMLDGSDELMADSVSDWGNEMLRLNRQYGVRILGGCCGTGGEHLKYIVDNYQVII